MKRFLKLFRYGEKGFTLIELLIVIAILGILAVIIIPNVAKFRRAGTLPSANTEASVVKTAVMAYVVEKGADVPAGTTVGPGRTGSAGDGEAIVVYIDHNLKAAYTINSAAGVESHYCIITAATDDSWGSAALGGWNTTTCEWDPPA